MEKLSPRGLRDIGARLSKPLIALTSSLKGGPGLAWDGTFPEDPRSFYVGVDPKSGARVAVDATKAGIIEITGDTGDLRRSVADVLIAQAVRRCPDGSYATPAVVISGYPTPASARWVDRPSVSFADGTNPTPSPLKRTRSLATLRSMLAFVSSGDPGRVPVVVVDGLESILADAHELSAGNDRDVARGFVDVLRALARDAQRGVVVLVVIVDPYTIEVGAVPDELKSAARIEAISNDGLVMVGGADKAPVEVQMLQLKAMDRFIPRMKDVQ